MYSCRIFLSRSTSLRALFPSTVWAAIISSSNWLNEILYMSFGRPLDFSSSRMKRYSSALNYFSKQAQCVSFQCDPYPMINVIEIDI